MQFAPTHAASPQELVVARELFEKAQAAQAGEDWRLCEESLTEATAIIETPGLRFHLAYCKERQGRLVEALVDYKRANELVESGTSAPDVAELLAPAVRRLEVETPKLTLKLDEIPDGAELFLDGERRSSRLLGKPIPIDPGGVRVNIAAPGYTPFSRHINLLARERRVLHIVLVPRSSGGTSDVQTDAVATNAAQQHDGISTKGWVLIAEGALTLGGLGMGVFYTSESSRQIRKREDLIDVIGSGGCSDAEMQHPQCPELRDTVDNIQLADNLATAGYVTAGVGVVAFVGTWLLWDTSPDSPNTTSAQLGVYSTPRGAFAELRGTY